MRRSDVPIGRYVDERFRSAEREMAFRWQVTEDEIDRRIRAVQDTATATARALESRLDGMNEFRSAMADQFARAVTREMFDAATESQTARVNALIGANSDRLDRAEAILDRQRGRQAAYAAIAAIAGVLLTIAIIAAGHIHVS